MRTPWTTADKRRLEVFVENLPVTLREVGEAQRQIHEDMDSLVRLLNPGEQTDRKPEGQCEAAEHPEGQRPPIATIRAKTELPNKLVDEYYANQKKSHRLQQRTFWVGPGTLVAVGLYAGITYKQWRTMDGTYIEVRKQTGAAIEAAATAQDALKEARANFIKDQRPWILMNAVLPEPGTRHDAQGHFAAGFPLLWRVCYSNYGRSPAIKVIGNARLFHGPNALNNADRYFRDLPGRLLGPSTVLPPGGPPAPQSLTPGQPPIEVGQGFSTINTETLSPGAIAFIYSHDFAIVAVGRFQYEDVSGNLYWTDFCRSTFLTGAINDCERHNEIH